MQTSEITLVVVLLARWKLYWSQIDFSAGQMSDHSKLETSIERVSEGLPMLTLFQYFFEEFGVITRKLMCAFLSHCLRSGTSQSGPPVQVPGASSRVAPIYSGVWLSCLFV